MDSSGVAYFRSRIKAASGEFFGYILSHYLLQAECSYGAKSIKPELNLLV